MFPSLTLEDAEQSISGRFDDVASANPDRIAIKTPGDEITYRELARRANGIASADPSDIEQALVADLEVMDAAVTSRNAATGEAELVGFIVPRTGQPLPPARIRAELRKRLPDHMIPSVIVYRDALPPTSFAKIDCHAIAELARDAVSTTSAGETSPPRGKPAGERNCRHLGRGDAPRVGSAGYAIPRVRRGFAPGDADPGARVGAPGRADATGAVLHAGDGARPGPFPRTARSCGPKIRRSIGRTQRRRAPGFAGCCNHPA